MKEKILKKGVKKRIFSVVLAVAMVVALMPLSSIPVLAEEDPLCVNVNCGHPASSHNISGGRTWWCYDCGMDTKCNDNVSTNFPGMHFHNSNAFDSNATQHWTKCDANDDGPTGTPANHTWSNGQCSICSYACTHTGGTATCTTLKVCDTCGASYGTTDDTNHSFATTWTSDETNHWHPATCSHTGEISGSVPHDTAGTYGGCSICGYGDTPPTPPAPEPSPSEPEESTPEPEVDETTFKVDIVKNDKTEVHNDIIEDVHVSKEAFNLSQFKTTKGFAFGIDVAIKSEQKKNEIAVVKSNKVEVYTGSAQTFGKACIEVLKTSSVDVVYTFKHKGLLFRVTIPAGTDISALLDENGFAGPLWIGKELGTAEVIKD